MSKYAGLVQNELRDLRGNAMTDAIVRVYNAGTAVLATLYDNPVEIALATGADTLINDAVTGIPASAGLLEPGLDEGANYTFYADSSLEYDINVTWQGQVFVYRVRPNLHAPSGTYPELRGTPPNPATAPAYIDTSTVPPILKVWDGAAWIEAPGGGGVAADVLLTELGDQLMTEGGDLLILDAA